MSGSKYLISFTTGGLYYREAVMAAELYSRLKNWDLVRTEILENNPLKIRMRSSLVRISRELTQRLKTLTPEQLSILADGMREEQNQILWLAVCKHYRFVREFAVEVLREKYLRLDLEVTHRDFDAFFNAKAEWDEDLDQITEMTRKKLRQVLFRFLTEAEILSHSNYLLPMMLSSRVIQSVQSDDPSYLSIFPAAVV